MKPDAQSLAENDFPEFVSTGQLPPDVQVQTLVDDATRFIAQTLTG